MRNTGAQRTSLWYHLLKLAILTHLERVCILEPTIRNVATATCFFFFLGRLKWSSNSMNNKWVAWKKIMPQKQKTCVSANQQFAYILSTPIKMQTSGCMVHQSSPSFRKAMTTRIGDQLWHVTLMTTLATYHNCDTSEILLLVAFHKAVQEPHTPPALAFQSMVITQCPLVSSSPKWLWLNKENNNVGQ